MKNKIGEIVTIKSYEGSTISIQGMLVKIIDDETVIVELDGVKHKGKIV